MTIRINPKSALWLVLAGAGLYFGYQLFKYVSVLSSVVN